MNDEALTEAWPAASTSSETRNGPSLSSVSEGPGLKCSGDDSEEPNGDKRGPFPAMWFGDEEAGTRELPSAGRLRRSRNSAGLKSGESSEVDVCKTGLGEWARIDRCFLFLLPPRLWAGGGNMVEANGKIDEQSGPGENDC